MKKIIIVNNNMKTGGVQKSLYNLLWQIHDSYDVTLLLFHAGGTYLSQLPENVRVITCKSLFRYLGVSQGECSGVDKLFRGALAAFCKLFGRPAVMKLLLASQKVLPQQYDCAISFLHDGNRKAFYGGAQTFVLRRIRAEKKVAFLHCDYRGCGADFPENNRLMEEFDVIAACSDGCGRAFRQVLPELGEKCVTVRNCHRYDQIQAMAGEDTVRYDPGRKNIVMVARLAHEKGIERAIEAVTGAKEAGLSATLHIVGDGGMRSALEALVKAKKAEDVIRFYGEQENPYRYMKNADLFLLTSYHEAAPMVIEEARCLGLPVLTVQTTSSHEMVTLAQCGWVCHNDQQAINAALRHLLEDPQAILDMRNKILSQEMNNSCAAEQFAALIGG